ncbi:ENTH/VHS family protein [Tasmannia lanceolata]|uniref:ENTH/VHS family protein n=1 Tax=Tasmannia lanceolata TaxID=3420 RepID=UPI004063FFC7
MSILGNNQMGTPFFHELKKQASFFFKEKIRTARLALTDVTPAQLLTEEATNGNPWGPDTRTMGLISRAAFEIDDYWRIVEILHNRFLRFDRKNWRESYKALILLEHLLTHGPESVAAEFHGDRDVIRELGRFQYIDERGFNWGLNMRKKSERILQLLEKGELLKEERNRARKISRGIEGFGSFCHRSSSSSDENFRESAIAFGRSNSHYTDYTQHEDSVSSTEEGLSDADKICTLVADLQTENFNPSGSLDNGRAHKKTENLRQPLKEKMGERSLQNIAKVNIVPTKKLVSEERKEWECTRESNPFLGSQKDEPNFDFPIEDHPFSDPELTTAALLSVS